MLALHEVHLHEIALDVPERDVNDLFDVLDDDERARAERFKFAHLRSRFIVAHAHMRRILADGIGAHPNAIRYAIGPHGKPAPHNSAAADVHFNLSHAGDVALLALSRGRIVGVDVEQPQPLDDMPDVAQRFFSAREFSAWMALAESQRARAFFRIWTRKEAFIKAIGDGLTYPLDQFDVSLDDDARLLRALHSAHDAWSLRDVSRGGYVAALCVQGGGWELVMHSSA